MPSNPAQPPIAAANAAALDALPFADEQDFEDARRGFIARLEPGIVTAADGRVVWDNDSYDFLDGPSPDTVHPSLWRQSQLAAIQGLFEVVPGIYQVRGLDLSNVTFVEGDTGVIVIDPLISTETAAAALALYRRHRGDRTVTGVIYTHSHVDHFGGVKGVTTQEEVDAGRVVVVAPEGFLEHAVVENVYAGPAMSRRAGYMYGASLERGPHGQVGAGLGQTTSSGTVTLIQPTLTVTGTGQVEVIDGVRIEFQVTPGTEAPSEMNFLFPDHRALCMAENTTHTLHNILTLRGAVVRDAHEWARYITEAIDLFDGRMDVAFASHHWPTWDGDRAKKYLSLQRDLYGYLHDQTLRMLNQGLVGAEVAERFELPPALEAAWHARGYYGSVSHNVKAVYQRYLGWFDGNPAHLWQHEPAEAARRYVDFMGGSTAVLEKARRSFAEGDYRWVVEVVNHVVFAEPENAEAQALQADALEQLGYGSENGTWRNFYLAGATELRTGIFGTPAQTASPDMLAALTPQQVFDAIAIRVDGPRAWHLDLTIDVVLRGADTHRLHLGNGVLVQRIRPDGSDAAPLTIELDAPALPALLGGDLNAIPGAKITGDTGVWGQLVSVLQAPDPNFAIVTP